MKVVLKKEEKKIAFKDLKVGEKFIFRDMAYLRLEPDSDSPFLAFHYTSKVIFKFSGNEECRPIKAVFCQVQNNVKFGCLENGTCFHPQGANSFLVKIQMTKKNENNESETFDAAINLHSGLFIKVSKDEFEEWRIFSSFTFR